MKRYGVYIGALILLGLGLAACSGLDAGDFVRVQTPSGVQKETGAQGSMTLNEAREEYEAYVARFQANASQWEDRIEDSAYVEGVVNQATLGFLEGVGPAIHGVPVLGPLAPVLTGLGGLFLRRPGDRDKDQTRKEKEASYKAGLEAGKALAGTTNG